MHAALKVRVRTMALFDDRSGRRHGGLLLDGFDFPAQLLVALGAGEAEAEPRGVVRDRGLAVGRDAREVDAEAVAVRRRVQ